VIQKLTFQTVLPVSFEATIEKVATALKAEGFGILTRIDVQATLKEKLDVDFRPYVILGACNPKLAHRALDNEPAVGALLPCNVTVEQTGETTLVSIVNPEAMLGLPSLSTNPIVCAVAAEARTRLERVDAALKA
jgi:uncharacterized protein (DUF302 family)